METPTEVQIGSDMAKDYAETIVQLAHANALLKVIQNNIDTKPMMNEVLQEKIEEYFKTGKTI